MLAGAYVAALMLLLSGALAAAVSEESWGPVALGAGTLCLGFGGMAAVFWGAEKGDYRIAAAGAAAAAAAAVLILA